MVSKVDRGQLLQGDQLPLPLPGLGESDRRGLGLERLDPQLSELLKSLPSSQAQETVSDNSESVATKSKQPPQNPLNGFLGKESESELSLPKKSEFILSFVCDGFTYQLEKVKCGKSGCKKCPHGPYWYRYHWEGGKVRKKYIGKKLADQSRESTASISAGETSI